MRGKISLSAPSFKCNVLPHEKRMAKKQNVNKDGSINIERMIMRVSSVTKILNAKCFYLSCIDSHLISKNCRIN